MAFGQNFEEEKSSFVNVKTSGLHDVTLVRVGSTSNKTGSKSLSFTLNGGGEYDDTLYAGVYENADGSEGFEKAKLLDSLAYICGVIDDSVLPQEIKLNNGKVVNVNTFTGFPVGHKLKVAVQVQYDPYYKEMKPKIQKFFSANGLSASEIQAGVTEPTQVKKFLNLEDKVKDDTKAKAPAADPVLDINPEDVF